MRGIVYFRPKSKISNIIIKEILGHIGSFVVPLSSEMYENGRNGGFW